MPALGSTPQGAAPLDTACQARGRKDSPHPSWASPLLSTRKWNRGLETGQFLLPWPWVEPEEPVRGKTGRRAGCGPSVQGPGPPGGPRGDSL